VPKLLSVSVNGAKSVTFNKLSCLFVSWCWTRDHSCTSTVEFDAQMSMIECTWQSHLVNHFCWFITWRFLRSFHSDWFVQSCSFQFQNQQTICVSYFLFVSHPSKSIFRHFCLNKTQQLSIMFLLTLCPPPCFCSSWLNCLCCVSKNINHKSKWLLKNQHSHIRTCLHPLGKHPEQWCQNHLMPHQSLIHRQSAEPTHIFNTTGLCTGFQSSQMFYPTMVHAHPKCLQWRQEIHLLVPLMQKSGTTVSNVLRCRMITKSKILKNNVIKLQKMWQSDSWLTRTNVLALETVWQQWWHQEATFFAACEGLGQWQLVPCAEERSFREWVTNELVLSEDVLCVSCSRHCLMFFPPLFFHCASCQPQGTEKSKVLWGCWQHTVLLICWNQSVLCGPTHIVNFFRLSNSPLRAHTWQQGLSKSKPRLLQGSIHASEWVTSVKLSSNQN